MLSYTTISKYLGVIWTYLTTSELTDHDPNLALFFRPLCGSVHQTVIVFGLFFSALLNLLGGYFLIIGG